jgi:hypothetical protein
MAERYHCPSGLSSCAARGSFGTGSSSTYGPHAHAEQTHTAGNAQHRPTTSQHRAVGTRQDASSFTESVMNVRLTKTVEHFSV